MPTGNSNSLPIMSEAAIAEAPAATPAAAPETFLGATPAATPVAPATPPSGFFGEHVQEGGNFKEGWTNAIAEKFPRLANQAMRYKSESDFFQGIDNALGLVGKKTAGISYPKEGATPEDVAAFRQDAGVPARAEEYNLKPDKLPEGIGWNDENGKAFAEIMHANHIPAGAAKALVEAHLQNVSAQTQQAAAANAAKLGQMVEKTTAEFRKEWGMDFQNRLDANNDFIAARLPAEDMSDPALRMALSHPAIVRMIDEARRSSREAPLPGVNATAGTGSMSPRQQGLEIIKANPQWRNDPDLTRRVNDLYSQEAAAEKRRSR